MGRFLVPVLQVVNIVQMIVNNVRASSGARRYTLVTYQTPCLQRAQPHMKSDGRQLGSMFKSGMRKGLRFSPTISACQFNHRQEVFPSRSHQLTSAISNCRAKVSCDRLRAGTRRQCLFSKMKGECNDDPDNTETLLRC
jgi:hypothetical protein